MAHVTSHPAGDVCWIELGTTDQEAGKTFYSQLFGWEPKDVPMGPEFTYTLFDKDGRHAGAGYKMGPEMAGVPPHWMMYVAVENADASAAKAKELGAELIMDPFDVDQNGRMCVMRDPAGSHVAIWQANQEPGLGVIDEAGSFCWADLTTGDAEKAAEFYKALFGWTTYVGEGSPYVHFVNGEKYFAGISPQPPQPGVPPHWLIYFYVEDADAAVAKVQALGGRVYMPATTMENVGRIAIVTDGQGAAFGLYQPEAK